MTYDKDQLSEENKDVLERNIEESRQLIEEKERQRADQAEAEGDSEVPRPTRDDPRFNDQSVPPGQGNVPAGGSTGSQQNLGGGYKSQPGD